MISEARKNPEVPDDTDFLPLWKCVLFIIIGLAMIIIGGQAVVYSSKEIAQMAGMTETLIGLTISVCRRIAEHSQNIAESLL